MKKFLSNAILKVICLLSLNLLFISCESFLEGSPFMAELAKDIEYAMAEECTLVVDSDKTMGSFLSSGDKNCKVGYTIDLQFTVDTDNYQFKKLEAVKSDDKSVSRSACVEFTVTEANEKTGIYKIQVKLIKASADILIRPVCYKRPSILSVSPELSNTGVPANASITVKFNMPMNKQNVLDNFSLLHIDSAKNNTDMLSYFEEPVFDEECKILTLTPKPNDLKNAIKDSAFTDLTLTFSQDITVTQDEINLPLAQNVKTSFKVRYKPEVEDTAPVKYDFFVTSSEISVSDASDLSDANKFTFDELSSFGDEEILKNRTNGTVYIYGRYYDAGSGVKSVTVSEKRTNNKAGEEVSETEKTSEPYTNTSPNAQFIDDGNGYTIFLIKYALQSDDGAILLSVSVADAIGNTDEEQNQSLAAIKDSGFSFDELKFYNNSTDITQISLDLQEIFYNAEYEADAATDIYMKTIYKNYKTIFNPEKMSAWLEYNLNGQSIRKDFTLTQRECIWYHPMDYAEEYPNKTMLNVLSLKLNDFTEESFASTKITIYVKDDLGSVTSKEFTIPKKPVFAYSELRNTYENYKQYKLYFSQIENGDGLIIWDDTGYCNNSDILSIWNDSTEVFTPQFTREGFYGPRGESFSSVPDNDALPALDNVTISYELIPDSENTRVIVTLPENAWDNYDNIYFVWEYGDEHRVEFEPNKNSACFVAKTHILYANVYQIYIFGELNGKITEPLQLTTEILSGDEFDNCSPYYGGYYYKDHYSNFLTMCNRLSLNPFDHVFICCPTDSGSGIDYITIKADGMETAYKYYADDYIVKDYYDSYSYEKADVMCIPVWDMDDDEYVNFNGAQEESNSYGYYYPYTVSHIKSILYDKKGNNSEKYSSGHSGKSFYYIQTPVISSKAKIDDSTERYTLKFGKISEHSRLYGTIFKLTYNEESNEYKWVEFQTTSSPNQVSLTHSYNFTGSQNTIYKVLAEENIDPNSSNNYKGSGYGFSDPLYICLGSNSSNGFQSSGKYDYILPVSGSKDSVLIASDATTFVHTLVTKKTYEECKNWDAKKWEHHRKHIGDYQMDFDSNDHSPQKYKIPVREIDSGDCYIVIAHFADGSTAISQVFQK